MGPIPLPGQWFDEAKKYAFFVPESLDRVETAVGGWESARRRSR